MFSRLKFVGLVLCLTSLLAPIYHVQAVNTPNQVKATVDNLNVRSGPALTYDVLSTINSKTALPVLSKKDNWTQVQLPDGKKGWLASWMVTTITPASTKQIQSKVDQLNVRSGPSTTFPVVKKIDIKTKFVLLQKNGEWAEIQLSTNQKGWVATWLVQEIETPTKTVLPTTTGSKSNNTSTIQQPNSNNSITVNSATDVYADASESSAIIGQLSPNDVVARTALINGWSQIVFDGQIAWIKLGGNTILPNGTPNQQNQATITVTASNVNLRSMPTTQSNLLASLSTGTKLIYLAEQGDWYQVQAPDRQSGWVASWLVSRHEPVPPTDNSSKQGTVTILEPDTNVRTGPGTTFDVVTRVQANETYPILKTEGNWFLIQLQDGKTGYIAGWLVQANGVSNIIRSTDIKDKVIVVDAGHGGDDSGAIGSNFGTFEKTVNLQVALLLQKKLEAAGAKILLTRLDDRKLTLKNRVDYAVQNNADLFVSVHHNTHPNFLTNGTIVFYYNKEESSKLATFVQSELVKATGQKDLQARFGDFYVIRENPLPSILAEIGFLTNYEEELRIRSEKQQDAAAEGLFKGIVRYFQNGWENQGE